VNVKNNVFVAAGRDQKTCELPRTSKLLMNQALGQGSKSNCAKCQADLTLLACFFNAGLVFESDV